MSALTLYAHKDLRDVLKLRPNARFRSARPNGRATIVNARHIETYFSRLDPRAAEYLGRWFEEIDPPSDDE